MRTTIICALMAFFGIVTVNAQSNNRQRPQKPPTVDEIFSQMDVDEDGKLSEKEVRGPLKNEFKKIDSDEDGFISREELEKAPKPGKNRSNKRND